MSIRAKNDAEAVSMLRRVGHVLIAFDHVFVFHNVFPNTLINKWLLIF